MILSEQREERNPLVSEPGGLFSPPEAGFTPERIQEVLRAIPTNEIVRAMASADNLTEEAAVRQIKAEMGRVAILAPTVHTRFYHEPIALLRERELIHEGFSAAEIGPALWLHWALLRPELTPGEIYTVEHDEVMEAGARAIIPALQKSGLLFTDGSYQSSIGDHQGPYPEEKKDTAFASLVAEYDAGEEGTLKYLMKSARWGVAACVSHTSIKLLEIKAGADELTGKTLPVRSSRSPGLETGVKWHLVGEPQESAFSNERTRVFVYEADFVLDPRVIGLDRQIVRIPVRGDSDRGKVTVIATEAGLEYRGFAYLPTTDDEEKIKRFWGVWQSLNDVFQGLDSATKGQRKWDSQAIWALPALAVKNNCYAALMATCLKETQVSGKIVPALILRYPGEVMIVHQAGGLSQVGPKEKGFLFATPQELIGAAAEFIQDPNFDKEFPMETPPLVRALITADKGTFDKLVKPLI